METRRFTWRTTNGNKHARLDFFLVSEDFFPIIETAQTDCGYRTDHSLIKLIINVHNENKGKSFWKFNNSLLKDPEYVKIVKNIINDIKEQYIDKENIPNNITISDLPNPELKFTINQQLFLDTLLMEIRGKTISYSSYKKKRADATEKTLLKKLMT